METFLLSTCTIAQTEAIQTAIAEHLADFVREGLVIDATAVEEADVSFVQILVAAGRTAAARNFSMTLLPSLTVSALLARAGLRSWAETVRA